MTTLSPFLISCAVSSVSRVAVRRKWAKAGNIRSASSTASGTSDRSSSSSWRCSGSSITARIAAQQVALVESLPAAISRKKPVTISCSSSLSPSTSAWTSTLVRSSVGFSRRAAISCGSARRSRGRRAA